MQNFLNRQISGWIVIIILLAFTLPVFSQINVTVTVNTSTNRDTLSESHLVQILGEASGTTIPDMSWGEASGIVMDNIGGDYWQRTFQVNPGDTVKYKFWTGFAVGDPTFFWNGWEGPLSPVEDLDSGGNRIFIAGATDTTLELQFYNGNETTLDQYWTPYESKPDSFAVLFRVNMAGVLEDLSFDPENDEPVEVRGGPPIDPADNWDVPVVLTREPESDFYSGAVYIADADITAGETTQQYQFVYRNGSVWESAVGNRSFTLSGANDSTIHWVYYNNQAPTGISLVKATLVWRLKTGALEKLGYFDRTIDKGIVIDGAKAWDVENAINLVYSPIVQEWIAEESFTKPPGATFEYKAVVRFDSSRTDSTSDNYIPGLDVLDYWEEPTVTGSGNRNYTFTSDLTQNLPGDLGFEYQFFNGLPAEGIIDDDIAITFNINMVPATSEVTNPSNPLFVPGDSVWIIYYGGIMPLTQGQGIYDNDPILMQDINGDNIYSATVNLTGPTVFDVGFRVQYREPSGGIIENGGGFSLGRSYYQFIQPSAVNGDGSIEWPATYDFPTLDWKDSDLPVEDAPDLWTPTAIGSKDDVALRSFELHQNYPNPFNPVTTIAYQVPHSSHVNINVYNIAGQLVNTLLDEEKPTGKYTLQWNGQDMRGGSVATGMYFLKMKADDFQKVHKIMLIK